MGRFAPQVPVRVAPVVDPDTRRHPAEVARDVAYLDPARRASVFRGRVDPPWDGALAAVTFAGGRALFCAVFRPAWAVEAPVVQDALGEFLPAVLAWEATATDDDKLAAWGLPRVANIRKVLTGIAKYPGYEAVPLSLAWYPTEPQVGLALRLLEARVAHAAVATAVSALGPPPPTMTAFKVWVAEHHAPPTGGRPRAPRREVLLALAQRNGRPLREVAHAAGCTPANLCYYLKNYGAEIDAVRRELEGA